MVRPSQGGFFIWIKLPTGTKIERF